MPVDVRVLQDVLHVYLRHCRTHGLAPEGLFLRKKLTPTLDLRHFSIGSQRALALSLALASLPFLQVWPSCVLHMPFLSFPCTATLVLLVFSLSCR